GGSGGVAGTMMRRSPRRRGRCGSGWRTSGRSWSRWRARRTTWRCTSSSPRSRPTWSREAMDTVYLLVAVALGLVGGAWLGTRLGRARGDGGGVQRAAAEEADKIRAAARVELEAVKQAAEVEGKEAARRRKAELDEELRARR